MTHECPMYGRRGTLVFPPPFSFFADSRVGWTPVGDPPSSSILILFLLLLFSSLLLFSRVFLSLVPPLSSSINHPPFSPSSSLCTLVIQPRQNYIYIYIYIGSGIELNATHCPAQSDRTILREGADRERERKILGRVE